MRSRLRFTVGTALLIAPLACTSKPPVHVNPGPQPEEDPKQVNVAKQPEPERPHVNEGPVEKQPEAPDKAPEELHVNPGPAPKR